MKARDVMSHPVITLRPHLPTRAAAARLVAHGFRAAPVVTAEGVVLGIVTEADLLRGQSLNDEVATGPNPPVADLMTSGLVAVAPDDDVAGIGTLMLDRGVRVVPVLDHGHLVGIITARDVLRRTAWRELVRNGYGAAV